MRDKLNQFMQGRYGNDDLNRFLMKIILAAFVLSLFTGRIVFGGVVSLSRIFYWIALALLIYCYIRMFSRNIYKRSEENRWFLNKTSNMRGFWSNRKYNAQQMKNYHIHKCPGCGQKIRIPRGKGKIEVRCPKCRTTFIKRS